MDTKKFYVSPDAEAVSLDSIINSCACSGGRPDGGGGTSGGGEEPEPDE